MFNYKYFILSSSTTPMTTTNKKDLVDSGLKAQGFNQSHHQITLYKHRSFDCYAATTKSQLADSEFFYILYGGPHLMTYASNTKNSLRILRTEGFRYLETTLGDLYINRRTGEYKLIFENPNTNTTSGSAPAPKTPLGGPRTPNLKLPNFWELVEKILGDHPELNYAKDPQLREIRVSEVFPYIKKLLPPHIKKQLTSVNLLSRITTTLPYTKKVRKSIKPRKFNAPKPLLQRTPDYKPSQNNEYLDADLFWRLAEALVKEDPSLNHAEDLDQITISIPEMYRVLQQKHKDLCPDTIQALVKTINDGGAKTLHTKRSTTLKQRDI